MSAKLPKASEAQARRLAAMWGGNLQVWVSQNATPLTNVLLEKGWIKPTGLFLENVSGIERREHVISLKGVLALTQYLQDHAFEAAQKQVVT